MTWAYGEPAWVDDGAYIPYALLDDGQWRAMTLPGASGYALMVASIYGNYMEGSNNGNIILQETPDGTRQFPFLVPAVVRWQSLLAQNGAYRNGVETKLQDVNSEYGAVPTPPVIVLSDGISDCWAADTWDVLGLGTIRCINTLCLEDECCGEGGSDALAAAWQLLPITRDAYEDIGDAIRAFKSETCLGLLATPPELLFETFYNSYEGDSEEFYNMECHCPVVRIDRFQDHPCFNRKCPLAGKFHTHSMLCEQYVVQCSNFPAKDPYSVPCRCMWNVITRTCGCGATDPTMVQEIHALDAMVINRTITAENILPEKYHALWHRAVGRFMDGLALTHQAALDDDRTDKEKECFTSLWRLLSPYSDMRSLEAHHRALCSHSTDSARLLAS